MKRSVLGLALASALVFAACDNELVGDLEVMKSLNIKVKDKVSTLQPGKYASKVKISETQIEFQVTANNQNIKWKMKVPAGSNLTPTSGKVLLKGSDIGQEFDFMAGVETKSESSQSPTANF